MDLGGIVLEVVGRRGSGEVEGEEEEEEEEEEEGRGGEERVESEMNIGTNG